MVRGGGFALITGAAIELFGCRSQDAGTDTVTHAPPIRAHADASISPFGRGSAVTHCNFAKMKNGVQKTTPSDVLRRPHNFTERMIRVHGRFRVAFDLIAVVDPADERDLVYVDVTQLPVTNLDDLLACRSRLVDIQGVLRPHREQSVGGWMIAASAMVYAEDQ
jgi:hypothetical protein